MYSVNMYVGIFISSTQMEAISQCRYELNRRWIWFGLMFQWLQRKCTHYLLRQIIVVGDSMFVSTLFIKSAV